MSLRWYSTVVDCADIESQSRWWAQVLGWQTIYASADEVAIIPAHLTEESLRAAPWEQVGPGLVFVQVPEGKSVKNRLHIDLAPHSSDDRGAEISRLLELGATLVDVGQPTGAMFTVLADPEGNEFCVLSARDV